MRDWYRERKARRKVNKVKPGDGSLLKPHRWWQLVHRSLFLIELESERGRPTVYAVDVDLFDEQWRAYLYTDGVQTAFSIVPALFLVHGTRIEVVIHIY